MSSYHGLVEQNEVHHGVAFVVFLKLGIQNSFQRRCVRDRGVRVGSALSAESREYHRWREHVGLVDGKGWEKRVLGEAANCQFGVMTMVPGISTIESAVEIPCFFPGLRGCFLAGGFLPKALDPLLSHF